MNVEPLAIEGVFRATPRKKAAKRFDWFRADALAPTLPAGWTPAVGTTHMCLRGRIKGLYSEAGHRIVTCAAGRVALVVVDVRTGSPTFGRWIPEDLDPVERVTVVIPPDVAWGFQGVSEEATLLSLHREAAEGPRLDPRDERFQITWPLNGLVAGPPHE